MSLYGASSIHVFKCPLQYCWLKYTRMRKNTSKLTYELENACLKTNILSLDLKVDRFVVYLMLSGREFHTLAANIKARLT